MPLKQEISISISISFPSLSISFPSLSSLDLFLLYPSECVHSALYRICGLKTQEKNWKPLSLKISSTPMAVVIAPSITFLTKLKHNSSPGAGSSCRSIPAKNAPRILSMSPQKNVNKYDGAWKKQWFMAGLFYEGREEVDVDVFKKLEKRKVLSNVEKAGLLSKAEELGFTLSSIEKLGVFSKAEELRLLSLLEKVASSSPTALAFAVLPILVAVRAVVAGSLAIGATRLFVVMVVLEGLQESN